MRSGDFLKRVYIVNPNIDVALDHLLKELLCITLELISRGDELEQRWSHETDILCRQAPVEKLVWTLNPSTTRNAISP